MQYCILYVRTVYIYVDLYIYTYSSCTHMHTYTSMHTPIYQAKVYVRIRHTNQYIYIQQDVEL